MKCAEGLVCNEVRVARSLVFCVVFCRLLYFFSSFFQLLLHILVVLIPLTSSG